MAQWLLGTVGILVGILIVAIGNGDELRQVSLFRRFGWSVVFVAVLLLLVTLVNEVSIPGL
jgi:putative copper export protein